MSYYKIKNLTKNFGKRDINKNVSVDIVLRNKYEKSNYKLGVNDVLFVELSNIPVTLHKQRMKGFISIVEISKNEFHKHLKPNNVVGTEKTLIEEEVVKNVVVEEAKPVVSKIKEKKTSYRTKTSSSKSNVIKVDENNDVINNDVEDNDEKNKPEVKFK